jgi:protein-disulfide isomerase
MSGHKQKANENVRQRKRLEREQRQVKQRFIWIGAGVLGVIVIIALLLAPRSVAQTAVTTLPSADDRALGPASAPVTIVEYGDFGCTTCRAWHNAGILDQVIKKYGDKVHFVWRDFPVITAQSPKAAEAGRCAADQDQFWPYHDLLYAKAPILDVASLKTYAAQLGLEAAQFNQCLDSGRHKAEVDRDWQDALARQFRGTPSFLINDRPLAGPPSFQTLQGLIDPILARDS